MADAAITECKGLLEKYRAAHTTSDLPANPAECKKILQQLKVQFIKFPSFLCPESDSPTRLEEVRLVRDAMEEAVLLAAAETNMEDFVKHFEILRVYYNDFPDEPKSERRLLILGLHLLRLLAINETRAFHMELERIKVVDQDSVYIKEVIQLERYHMEGSYHKMLEARSTAPSPQFARIMEMLLVTARREVFACAMKSYEVLSIEGARKLLMFDDTAGLLAFIDAEKKRWKEDGNLEGWIQQGDNFVFNSEHGTTRRGHLPFNDIITNNLNYSNELQRIV